MISDLGRYFLGIVSVAIICAILTGLQSGTNGPSRLGKLVSGLVLALCVIAPLEKLSPAGIFNNWSIRLEEGSSIVDQGLEMVRSERMEIIYQQTTAYILDKANAMGLEVEVEITLQETDAPIPIAVTLKGRASPYSRQSMEELLYRELGIPKEKIIWTE